MFYCFSVFKDTTYTNESIKEETANKHNNNNNNNNNKWWTSPLVSSDAKNQLCENGWECLVSKSDFVIFRKSNPDSTSYTYKGDLFVCLFVCLFICLLIICVCSFWKIFGYISS